MPEENSNFINVEVQTSSGNIEVEINPDRSIKYLMYKVFDELGHEVMLFREYVIVKNGSQIIGLDQSIEVAGIEDGNKVTLQPEPEKI